MYIDVLKRAHIRAINLRCAKVSQPDSLISPQLIYIGNGWPIYVYIYIYIYLYILSISTP